MTMSGAQSATGDFEVYYDYLGSAAAVTGSVGRLTV